MKNFALPAVLIAVLCLAGCQAQFRPAPCRCPDGKCPCPDPHKCPCPDCPAQALNDVDRVSQCAGVCTCGSKCPLGCTCGCFHLAGSPLATRHSPLILASLDHRPRRYGANVGGPEASDGTYVRCDLPGQLHMKNVGGSDGAGLCVFTSISHSARWQNVEVLADFQGWMKKHPGGGYPEKVDKMIEQIAKEKNQPKPGYVQVEGMDLEVLKLACKTGRMPGVTYSVSPTGRYNGQRIAHMVSLVHADGKHYVILDNNYPGEDKYEWLSEEEFKKTYAPGWAVILLNPAPPPPPRNPKRYEARDSLLCFAKAEPQEERREQPDPGPPAFAEPTAEAGEEMIAATPMPFGWEWRRVEDRPRQRALCVRGIQVGSYDLDKDQYRPYDPRTRLWGDPCTCPCTPPRLRRPNYGVRLDKLCNCRRYNVNGEDVPRSQVLKLLAADPPKIPDDSHKYRLTVIGGTDQERQHVLTDWQTRPEFGFWRDKTLTQSYPADHWYVARNGFVHTGHPTIYFQAGDGTDLHRQDDYADGAAGLAAAIGKADPNYKPELDRDLRKVSPLVAGALPWSIYAVGAVGAGLYLFRRTTKASAA